jgi:hypothetical protein
MPTKCGYYSDENVDKKFSQKETGTFVRREQYPEKFPDADQDKLEYSPPPAGGRSKR